jgi:hypothetical protein
VSSTVLPGAGRVKCIASDTRLTGPLDNYDVEPRVGYEGDVVVVRALGDHGAYAEVETMSGRSERLHEGDVFLAVLGNRQSLVYLNGVVPDEGLSVVPGTTLHLLSNGGIVGMCVESPPYLSAPLELDCLGVLVQGGAVVNTIQRVAGANTDYLVTPYRPLVLVAGSVTDVGKTTLTARLIANLAHRRGLRVAAAKLAGTGCLEDVLLHQDAGAEWIADFPDFGLPSTYTSPANYTTAIDAQLLHLSRRGPDVIVAELGGDLLWANIPTLFGMPGVRGALAAVIVIPSDVLAALGARSLLDEWKVERETVLWCIPPRCNSLSFRQRMDVHLPGWPLYDTRCPHHIDTLAERVMVRVRL